MSETYTREGSYYSYSPATANANMMNEAVAGTAPSVALLAINLYPSNPSHENLPILDPSKKLEEKRAQGDGLHVGEVYDLGWEDGSGSKRSVCIFGLHINDSFDILAIGDMTRDVLEISTVVCGLKSTYTDAEYFCFDGIDSDADYPVVKYYVWVKVTGGGADPVIAGRIAVEADIQGATSENDVAVIIAGVIDTLDDFGAGAVTTTVTITNGTAGAVNNAYDGGAGTFTLAVTQDGVTTKTITEATTLPNIGFHVEKELTGEDIRTDHSGITQVEYTWECESGGILEEERGYLIANAVAGANLARPIGPDGNAWTSAQHPYSKYKRAFEWGNFTFTFQLNSNDIECQILSISIRVSLEVDYKRNGGSSYSNGRELKVRDYEISMRVKPTGTDLRDLSRTHYKDYGGAGLEQLLSLTVKAQRAADANDYIQWVFTKLRLLPYDQILPIEPYYEETDIVLHGAPGNATTVTVKGYLSQNHYGVA